MVLGLFKKTCPVCGMAIEKGSGITAQVAVPGYVGEQARTFCSDSCVQKYKATKTEKKAGGSCCH